MGPNIAELDALLAWAEEEHAKAEAGKPSEWDQGYWASNSEVFYRRGREVISCGTACCLAGKAVNNAGGEFIFPFAGSVTSLAVMPDGQSVNIEVKAKDLLGLTQGQADALFAGSNGIEEVRTVVAQIKAGEPFPEPYTDDENDW